MILAWFIIILMAGGLLAWLLSRINEKLGRIVSLAAVGINFLLILPYWFSVSQKVDFTGGEYWIESVNTFWIPEFGIRFHLAMDGLSLLLVTLTFFLGILSVLTSWREVKYKTGFFHFNLLWILAGITGVFLALDLFLFYFFWEVMLIPMYFLIGIWGHENRKYAAYKFFLFTQASGLLMFLAIIALYFIGESQSGVYSFSYFDLLGTQVEIGTARWLMLGFLIAFVVKLPAVPFHNWLPDAHTEAPTAGSVILAGLLLKTGAYGILRFVLPLFPDASAEFSSIGMFLGVIGILYGAKLAFAQTDLKRLVAYSSVSHMGFVLLGVYSFNTWALQGVIMQLLTHGISTGALFILVGTLQERIHTRDIEVMGGFWENVPRMGGVAMVFTMASLGLPGLGNFIAEFITLVGAYQANVFMTVLASLGLVASTLYSLRIVQRVFHGSKDKERQLEDFNIREMVIMGLMIAAIVWLGLYPQPVFNSAKPSLDIIKERVVREYKEVAFVKEQKPKNYFSFINNGEVVSNLNEVYRLYHWQEYSEKIPDSGGDL
jgi:NADH-quinone oxidoreductase subunit M